MSRTLVASLFAATTLTLSAAAETRTYDLSGFDGLQVSSAIDAEFSIGETFSIDVETENGNFDEIEVLVDGDDLVLKRPRTRGWSYDTDEDYLVRVTAPALSRLGVSSAASVTGSGLAGEEVVIDASSGSEATVRGIDAGDLVIDASSGTSLQLTGSCGTIMVDASSGASIRAAGVECTGVVADLSSGADLRAYATESVQAEASSGASVRVSGGATDVTTENSSGGTVRIGR